MNLTTQVLKQFVPNSEILFIIFASRGDGKHVPIFEMRKIFSNYSFSKLFFRDCRSTWYINGISGINGGYIGLNKYIREIIDKHSGIHKVITIGNSCGGFASLLYGSLIPADEIHAFSPQVAMSPKKLHVLKDKRWNKYLHKIKKAMRYGCSNVTKLIENNTTSKYYIYFSSENELDNNHVKLIPDSGKIDKIPLEGDNHSLIKTLRNNGKLDSIIQEIIGRCDLKNENSR